MNILICSVGRRTKLLRYFKEGLNGGGSLIAADCSRLAPALYEADKYFVVPRIDEPGYIDRIKDICSTEHVDGVLSLIDPELSLIAAHAGEFHDMGVRAIVSPLEVCETCLDKYAMFRFCQKEGFKCAHTYLSAQAFEDERRRGRASYPVFVKPRWGSASIGAEKIYDDLQLMAAYEKHSDLLVQEFLDGEEHGIDVYVDLISKKVVSIFAKKKLAMRSGETDKALSVKCPGLFELIEDFITRLGAAGPLDIDVFKIDGEYYISEVNPRFGGGYPLAYECGCVFPKYIINNLMDIENMPSIGEYREGVIMLKHDGLMTI